MDRRSPLHTGGHRRNALWIAAMVHRISGLALGLAIQGEAQLDGFLKWSANPYVKLAETGLIFLLAVHMLGGLRVLAIENLPWREGQRRLAVVAGSAAIVVAALFLLSVVI